MAIMTTFDNIQIVRDNLVSEILALQSQIIALEGQLAGLPAISESGPGTSFGLDPQGQLESLNNLITIKLKNLETMNLTINSMFPYRVSTQTVL